MRYHPLLLSGLMALIPLQSVHAEKRAETQSEKPLYMQSCEEAFNGMTNSHGQTIVCDRTAIDSILQSAQKNDSFDYKVHGDGVVCMVDNQYPEENGALYFVITRAEPGSWSPFLMYGSGDQSRAIEQGWLKKGLLELTVKAFGKGKDIDLYNHAAEYVESRGYTTPNPGATSCDAPAIS